jgi:beta-lactamase class A
MLRFVVAVGLGTWVLGSAAHAADLATCNFAGGFARSVAANVRAARVPLVSYAAMIVRADGTVLCSDEVNADTSLTPASSIKTLVAVAALRKIDRGDARLTDTLTINQPNAAADCRDSSCAVYGPGKKVTLKRLLTDMIIASNNVATNQLVDFASKPFITETARLVDAPSLELNRKLYSRVPAEPDNPTPNRGSARGLVNLYREVATGHGNVLTPASRAFLVDLLGRTYYRDRLNAWFPANVRFFHKIGNTSTVSADAGFFWIGRRTAVIVAGIQGFLDYAPLKRIGRALLDLTLRMR